MARILIVGASGLLGINLALEAMREHEVIGVDRGRLKSTPFPVFRADLFQEHAMDPILEAACPEWLVNCAAIASLEECEEHPERAKRLNADLPGELASLCARKGIHFVHVSTDAVFDGERKGTYTEKDEPKPLGRYSQTKLDGERAVREADPGAIVARVNFYGWSLNGQHSLGEFFVNNLSAGKSVYGFTDVIFCPMWVNHLSQALITMLEKGLSGLYHVVGSQPMSKYQFGVEIARKFGLKENLIVPRSVDASGLTARRAHNLRLSTHKLSTDLAYDIPMFSTGLEEFYTQYQQGYPQKLRSYQHPQDSGL
ncbi:MAG TPA: SDR family oxidoreductase [Anaerolineales bacterium]|nr:SDR family oxidoreductase [Anaerolineales bacterium]